MTTRFDRIDRCEYVLKAPSGPLSPRSSLHLDAYLNLMVGLNATENAKEVWIAPHLKPLALKQLNLDGLLDSELARLRMNSLFESQDEFLELELFIKGRRDLDDRVLKLFAGEEPLYFWKKVNGAGITYEVRDGENWPQLPRSAQVGLRLLHGGNGPQIFLSVQMLLNGMVQLTLGLDVDCSSVRDYATSAKAIEIIQLPEDKRICRVKVLYYRSNARIRNPQ